MPDSPSALSILQQAFQRPVPRNMAGATLEFLDKNYRGHEDLFARLSESHNLEHLFTLAGPSETLGADTFEAVAEYAGDSTVLGEDDVNYLTSLSILSAQEANRALSGLDADSYRARDNATVQLTRHLSALVRIRRGLSQDEELFVTRFKALCMNPPSLEVRRRISMILNNLNLSRWGLTRIELARNVTSTNLLYILSHCQDEEVVKGVASNPNASVSLLTILSRNQDSLVRLEVACHRNTPVETVRNMIVRPNEQSNVIAAARENLRARGLQP